jgi:hypothetical protein
MARKSKATVDAMNPTNENPTKAKPEFPALEKQALATGISGLGPLKRFLGLLSSIRQEYHEEKVDSGMVEISDGVSISERPKESGIIAALLSPLQAAVAAIKRAAFALEIIASAEMGRAETSALLNTYVGTYVYLVCARYGYRGIVVGVTDQFVVLHAACVVQQAGHTSDPTVRSEDPFTHPVTVNLQAVEVCCQPKFAFAPQPAIPVS